MAYETTTTPTKLPDAFGLTDASAVQSQAAFLLYLGVMNQSKTIINQSFRKETECPNSESRGLSEDLGVLGITAEMQESIQKDAEQNSNNRGHTLFFFSKDREISELDDISDIKNKQVGNLQTKLFNDLLDKSDPITIPKLIAVSLHHPDLLVRVAAAISGFDVLSIDINSNSNANSELGKTLIDGVNSDDKLIRDMAATALARLVPNHPELASLTSNSSASEADLTTKNQGATSTSLLIHGTWASSEKWWQPGGDFHNYYKNTCDHYLYSGNDRFEWSGSYSDRARWLGAFDLVNWIRQKGLTNLNLIGHSHGANITMLASQGHGMRMNTLVLLSCPVHWDEYWPDFTHVNKVVSIRVKLDLVILADRGGQRFPSNSNIVENVLPVWFNHSLTHDPEIWQAYNIPSMI